MSEPLQLNLLDHPDEDENDDRDDGSWEWWWRSVAVACGELEKEAA